MLAFTFEFTIYNFFYFVIIFTFFEIILFIIFPYIKNSHNNNKFNTLTFKQKIYFFFITQITCIIHILSYGTRIVIFFYYLYKILTKNIIDLSKLDNKNNSFILHIINYNLHLVWCNTTDLVRIEILESFLKKIIRLTAFFFKTFIIAISKDPINKSINLSTTISSRFLSHNINKVGVGIIYGLLSNLKTFCIVDLWHEYEVITNTIDRIKWHNGKITISNAPTGLIRIVSKIHSSKYETLNYQIGKHWRYFDKWRMVDRFDLLAQYDYGYFEYVQWRYFKGRILLIAPKGYNVVIYKLTNLYITLLKTYLHKTKTVDSVEVYLSNTIDKTGVKLKLTEELSPWEDDFFITIKYKPKSKNLMNDIKPFPIFSNRIDGEYFNKNDI